LVFGKRQGDEMKTVLLTGADGMLGVDLVSRMEKGPYRLVSSTIQTMDIVDPNQVKRTIFSVKPELVIHTAAYTAVDHAESEKDLCMAVNHLGTRNLAMACREIDAELVYISTDYVFDGTKTSPYEETDIPHPLNVYGESKYLGEQAVSELVARHKICRTSWLLGLLGISGSNFLEKIFQASQTHDMLKVVSDQMGCPTFTFDLALMLERLVALPEYGIFHVTNSGACSWYELAKTALEMNGQPDVKIVPVSAAEFPRPAKRPRNSVLASGRLAALGIPPLRSWEEGLQEYILKRKEAKEKG
jgi:dTDP-4-dehydrorhamnose reductase